LPHALVIEDRFLIAMAIQDELLECGYDSVAMASSQQEAIQLAQQQCPDLITADDQLDEGSGVAAIREICKDRELPVVFITADPHRIKQAVPDAIIILKPFSARELVGAIDQAVGSFT
jgi:CheY-like chemotaxis protein